jgi:hypothetical protein
MSLTPDPCMVCALVREMNRGTTPEVAIVCAILHGVAASSIAGGRPRLCDEHDVIRVVLLDHVAHAEDSAGLPS